MTALYGILFALLQVILILIPGMVAAMLNGSFGSGRRSNTFNTLFVSLGYASISYCLLAVIYHGNGIEFTIPIFMIDPETFGTLQSVNLIETLDEIVLATLISLVMVSIWLLIYRHRYIVRVLRRIGLTSHFGEKDLWTDVLTHEIKTRKFVQVRDITTKYIYTGWIEKFSEYDNFRELYLIDAETHDFNHKYISKSKTAYIGIPNTGIVINFFSEERRIKDAGSTI